jgi:hypothetical protein
MIERVEEWTPPTSEHSNLKKFCLEQLTDALKFDCGGDYYERCNKELDKLTFDKWYQNKKDALNRSVEYHAAENKNEIERVKKQNQWIIELYKSLGLKI